MKKILQKVLVVVTLLTLVIAAMEGLPFNANAQSPALFEFNTWTGSGVAAANIALDKDEFVKLTYNSKDVDNTNYTVTGTESSTVITLTEKYLKTFENGEYHLWGNFSGASVVLQLNVNKQNTVPSEVPTEAIITTEVPTEAIVATDTPTETVIETETPATTTPASSQRPISPKTSDEQEVTAWLIIAFLSAISVAVVLKTYRSKNIN